MVHSSPNDPTASRRDAERSHHGNAAAREASVARRETDDQQSGG